MNTSYRGSQTMGIHATIEIGLLDGFCETPVDSRCRLRKCLTAVCELLDTQFNSQRDVEGGEIGDAQDICLPELAEECRSTVATDQATDQATLTVEPSGKTQGDESRPKQLLENLFVPNARGLANDVRRNGRSRGTPINIR